MCFDADVDAEVEPEDDADVVVDDFVDGLGEAACAIGAHPIKPLHLGNG